MADGYVDEIDEQGDDTRPEERELSEDAQWKKIQKNTFTRWTNQHLKVSGLQISDLQCDLSDGLKLVTLIEVLASHKFKQINKRPTFRTQKLENVTKVLKFLEESEQLRLVNIDSSDIVDSRLKLILGLIWTLILHFSISMPLWEGEEPIAKDAKGKGPTPKHRILSWVNTKMHDKPVKNLTSDWNNGTAIGALVDALAPGLCPDWTDWDPKDALKNAKEAMDLAEKWLDIAQLLKPDELVDPRIDEKAMMTYLSQFPQAKLKEGAPLRPKTNPARVRAYGPGLEKTGNAIKAPARFVVDTFSAGSGKLDVVVLNPKGSGEPCTVELKENQNQAYACFYTPTMEGEYRVIIKYAGKEITNSPFQVPVEGAAGDPKKVTASGPGIEKTGNIMGKKTHFNVFINGAGRGNIECKIKDPHGREEIVRPLITKQSEENYLVEYTPILGGLHSVSVLFAGHPIPLSPFQVEVGADSGKRVGGEITPMKVGQSEAAPKKPHPLESHPIMQGNGVHPGGMAPNAAAPLKSTNDGISLKPGATVPEAAYVTGRGVQPKGLRVNEPTEFTVHTENAGSGKVKAKIIGPGGVNENVRISATNEVTHVCCYTPTKIGQYVIVVEYSSGQVQKSPFKVDVAGACTSKVIAYGPGLKSGVVNTPAPFTVESHGSPGELGFSVEGASEAKITCANNKDGSVAVQYLPTLPGEYAVHVLCNKEDIKGSPFLAQICDLPKDAADVAKLKAFGPGIELTGVEVNKETNFTVDVKETKQLLELKSWCWDSNGTEIPVKILPKSDGTFTCTYTSKFVSKLSVYISYGGIQLPKSPYTVNVSGGQDLGVVTAYGPGLETATFSKPAIFTVDTKGAGGDTGPVNVDIVSADGKKIPFQSRDKDGLREVQYTPSGTTQTTYTINISYKNQPIKSSPYKVTVSAAGKPTPTGAAYATGRGIQSKGIRINEEVEFVIHTEKTGVDSTPKVKVIGPGGVQETVKVTKISTVEFQCTYKPSKVGNYIITTDYAGSNISNSPFKVEVAHEKTSKIKAYGPGLERATVDALTFFTVETNGESSELGFSINGPSEAKMECIDNGDGSVLVKYLPSMPGEYAVHVLSNNEDISKSPFMVMATEEPLPKIDGSKVKVFGPGVEPNGNMSGKSTSFTIDAKAFKEKKPIGVTCIDQEGVKLPVQVTEKLDGTATCSYTPTKPTKHTIYVTYDNQPAASSPYKVNVALGISSGVKISGPGIEKASIGQATFFTIDTTEVGSQTTALTIDIKSNKGQQVPFNSKLAKPGICEVTYTPTGKENSEIIITVSYSGEPVKGSPFNVPVSGGPKEISTGKISVTGKGILPTGVRATETVTFKVHRDQPTAKDTLKTKIVGPNGTPVNVLTKKVSNDTHECQYVAPKEGSYVISVDMNDKPVDKSPYKVEVAPFKDSKIKAYGPGLEGGVAGVPAPFIVNTNGSQSELGFRVEGPSEAVISCKDNGDGTVGVEYLPKDKGEYVVHVLADKEEIARSPFVVDVGPSPDNSFHPENVKAYGPGLQTPGVVPQKATQFTIDSSQAGIEKPIVIKCYDTDGSDLPVTVSTPVRRTSQCQYTPSKKGKHTVSVLYGGVPIANSPFTVNVGNGDLSSPVTAYGPGLQTALINSPVSFIVDATKAPGPLNNIQHSIVDDKGHPITTKTKEVSPGKQEISYTVPQTEGVVTVNVSHQGKPIDGSPFSIHAVPALDDKVTVTGRGIEPKGLRIGEEVSFCVQSENGVTSDNLKTKIIGPGGHLENVRQLQISPNKCQCTYTPSSVGPYSIAPEVCGKPVDKSPFNVNIAGPCLCPVRAFGTGLENGEVSKPATFVVETNGQTGNIEMKIRGPGEAKIACSNFKDGKVTGQYTPELPGEYTVRVLSEGVDVKDSPFVVPIMAASGRSPDVSKVKMYGPGLEPKGVKSDNEATFTVDTKSCGPEPVVTAACYNQHGEKIPIVHKKDTAGLDHFGYCPKEDGSHVVQIHVDNKEVTGSPFNVDVAPSTDDQNKARPIDKVLTYGRGLDFADTKSNKPSLFYVDLRNCESEVPIVPEIEVLDAEKRPVSSRITETNTPKLYEVAYQSSESPLSTKFYPSIKVGGEHVPGSPFLVAPMEKTPAESAVGSVEELKKNVKVDEPQTFKINLKEGLRSEPTVSITDNGTQAQIPVQISKTREGQFEATYTAKEVQSITINASHEGKPVAGTPANVSVVTHPIDVDQIKIEGLAPIVQKGKPQTFDVISEGLHPLKTDLVDLKVISPSDVSLPVHKEALPNGVRVSYTPTEDGAHLIGCWVQDQPVEETPCVVKSVPKKKLANLASESPTRATMTNVTKPEVNSPCSFLLETGGLNGPEKVQIKVLSPDSHDSIPLAIKEVPRGLLCEFVATNSGPHTVLASTDGLPIQCCPSILQVEAKQSSLHNPVKDSAGHPGHPLDMGEMIEDTVIQPQFVAPVRTVPTQNVEDNPTKLSHPTSVAANKPFVALEEAVKELKDKSTNESKWPQSHPDLPSAKVKAHGEGLQFANAVDKATFTIDSRDAPTAPLGVTVEGPGEAEIKCIDNGDGTCGVEYEAPVPGLYTINVLYDNIHIPESPFVAVVYPKDKKFLDLSSITATGPGLNPGGVFKDSFARFSIDASKVDSKGSGTVKALIQTPSGKKTLGTVDNLKNGRYNVQYSPTEEGIHKIHVLYEGLPILHSPFSVPSKPGFNAKLVTARGPGLETCKVNLPTEFVVDLDGAGHGSLGLSIEGPADAVIECRDNKDGTCLVSYTPTKAGEYDISVKFNDEDITDSPFRVRVLDQVRPEKVKSAGPRPYSKQNVPNHFLVDASAAGEAPLKVQVEQPDQKVPAKPAVVKRVEGAQPGLLDVTFVPESLGPCLVHVTYDDSPIKGSPFKSDVVKPAEISKVNISGNGIAPINGTILASMPEVFYVDTKDAGQSPDVNVGLFSPNGEPMPLRIESTPNGLFTCEYQTHEVGDHKINVDVDGQTLPKSPFTIKSLATGNADKCQIKDGRRNTVEVNKESVIIVETKEAGRGQITCTVKKIQRQMVGQVEHVNTLESVKVHVEEQADGVCSVHYTPREQGEYVVDVKFGGNTVPNGKFTQTAVHEYREVRNETTQIRKESKVASSAFHEVDFNVNQRSMQIEDLKATVIKPSGQMEPVKLAPSEEAPDKMRVLYQPTERGAHQLQITCQERPIAGSPFQFFVDTKGEGRVSAYGPGLTSGRTNELAEFVVVTKDAGPGALSLVVEGPSKTEIKCEDKHDGTFQVFYVPQAPGDYKIIIKFKDQEIAGSPFVAKVSGDSVKKSQLAVGNSSEVPLDITGKDMSTLTAELTTPSKKQLPCVIKKMANGSLGVSFTPKEIGQHLVNVYDKGVNIPGSPFNIDVKSEEVGDAGKVKLFGTGLEKGQANQSNEFTIDTKGSGYGSLNISIEGPSKAEIDCKENDDGTCNVKYVPTQPGDYVINVKYAGKDVKGSPFNVKVGGDAPVSVQREEMEHAQVAAKATTIGGSCEINIKTNDIPIKDLKAAVRTPSGFTEPCDIDDDGNGNLKLKFVARESGVHYVTVLNKDRHITGSPFQFTVGRVEDGGSKKVTASGPGLERGFLKVGNEFAIYTREAGAGNLSLAMEGPSKPKIEFLESPDSGSCNVKYFVSQPGEYELGIKFNNEHIANSPFRILVDDEVSQLVQSKTVSSSLDSTTVKETGGLVSFTVRTSDGETAKLEAIVETPSGHTEPAVIQQVGEDQFGIKFKPTESGLHLVHVEDNKRPIKGSPFRIQVGEYKADPGMVIASGEGLSRATVNEKAHFFVNTANAGSGSLNVGIDGPSKVKLNCHETDEGYEFTYVATASGQYKINVTFGGNFHIVGSPFTVVVEGTETTKQESKGEQCSQVEIEASEKRCVSQYTEKAGSNADKVVCQGLGLKHANLDSVNSFFIDASQAGYDMLLIGVCGPVRPCEQIVVKHVGNNQFTVDYVVRESGLHVLMVKWGDKDVPGSPFLVHVD